MARKPGRGSGPQSATRGKDKFEDAHPVADPTGALDLSTLNGTIGYLLRRAQLAIFDDFIRTFSVIGLRPAQFSVLSIVEKNPGLKQSEIAAALGIQRTNFVAMMDELEERGLATREPSPLDRRSYAVALTADGRAMMKRALVLLAEHETRMAARLDESDRAELMRLLQLLLPD